MSVLAVRGGNIRLVDDGAGMGHVESGLGVGPSMPVDAILKWGHWKPVDESVTAAGPLEGERPLRVKYERVLERSARRAEQQYLRAMRSLVAAEKPRLEDVLDESTLSESQRRALKAAREKLAQEAATAQAVQFGISFAVSSPHLKRLVDEHAGKQAERIVEGSRQIVARVIQRSFDEGWSVPQTAAEIKAKLRDAKKWQATMLARTDLIGLANAGSYAAALQLGELRPVYKRWINADDEKVRPTHVEAMNQVVPLEQPFLVGHAHLRFPGDPLGPDEEVINCRCTQVYLDDPASIVDHLAASLWFQTTAAAWVEAEHPRDEDGKFSEKNVDVAARWDEANNSLQEDKARLEKMWAEESGENDFYSDYYRAWADHQFNNGGYSTLPDDWQKGWTWGDDALAVDREIFSSEPLRDDIAVWRGAYGQAGEPSARPISTSFERGIANSYSDRAGTGNTEHLHRVLVPAGSHVGWHSNESEIVLPTGTVLENAGPNLWIAKVPETMVDRQVLRASTWDESEHPRDPGGEGGGQWIAKGASTGAGPVEVQGGSIDEILKKMGAFDYENNPERNPERFMKHPKSGFNVAKPGVIYPETVGPGDGKSPPRVRDVTNGLGFAAPPGFENAKPLGYGKYQVGEEHPPEYLFRAVSEAEYQGILKNGYMQSDQRMNLSNAEGTVVAFSDPRYYLPGALASDKPGTYEGRVIRIKYRDEDGWRHDTDDYVKTNKPVPLSQIDMVTPKLVRQVTKRPDKSWNDIGEYSLSAAGWDESEHPRHPGGTSEGGKFAPKDMGGPTGQLSERIRPLTPDEMAEMFAQRNSRIRDELEFTQTNFEPAGIKERVAQALAARLDKDPEWKPQVILDYAQDDVLARGSTPSERAASLMVSQWAKSATDTNVLSLVVQQAVADEFGIGSFNAESIIASDQTSSAFEKMSVRDFYRSALSNDELYGSVKAYVRAQYAETQARFGGTGDVLLWRGMRFGYYEPNGAFVSKAPFEDGVSTVGFDQNPASSWTTDYTSAKQFTDIFNGTVIFAAKVPVSRILATPLTGMGCLGEREVVLIGAGHGEDEAIVGSWVPTREERRIRETTGFDEGKGPVTQDEFLMRYSGGKPVWAS